MTTGSRTTYPATVQAQLAGVVALMSALLGQNLRGLYLTGDGFTGPSSAEVSTLRVLIVTARDLLRDTRLGLMQTFLGHSLQPAALEVLVVREADLASAHPSLLVQLQFSEALRPQLERETTGH